MITGTISSQLEAIVEVTLARDPEDIQLRVEAVVDSGFSDYVMLPLDLIEALALNRRGKSVVILSDGSDVVLDLYDAYVRWHDDKWLETQVTASEGSPLIGMALLAGSRLAMDIIAGGAVMITPLA